MSPTRTIFLLANPRPACSLPLTGRERTDAPRELAQPPLSRKNDLCGKKRANKLANTFMQNKRPNLQTWSQQHAPLLARSLSLVSPGAAVPSLRQGGRLPKQEKE